MSTNITHDNHVHTRYCGHSGHDLPLVAYRDAAAERGLTLSLREHAPLPEEYIEAGPPHGLDAHLGPHGAIACTMDPFHVDALLRDAADLGISLGFEVDVLPGFLGASERVIAELRRRAERNGIAVDAFNASHHMYRGRPWDSGLPILQAMLAEFGQARFIRDYFGAIREAVGTGLFNCVSHIDGPLRFSPDPLVLLGRDGMALYQDEFLKTLEVLAETGTAIEYNSSGLRRPIGRPLILASHLRAAAERGVPVVVGSDAHAPDEIGHKFDFAARELAAAGVATTYRFVGGVLTPADEIRG